MNSTTDVIGALPPPPGVIPNFENPDFHGQKIIIVGIIFPVLTIPFLVARLYAKGFLIKRFHLDDCKSPSKVTGGRRFQLTVISRHDNDSTGAPIHLPTFVLTMLIGLFPLAIHTSIFNLTNIS